MNTLLDRALILERKLEDPDRRVVHQLRLMYENFLHIQEVFEGVEELQETIDIFYDNDDNEQDG